MTRRLGVALVGCGGISRAHLPNILGASRMRLVATVDLDEGRARERAEQGQAAYYTTDAGRVLAAYYFTRNDGNGFGGTRHIAASSFRID